MTSLLGDYEQRLARIAAIRCDANKRQASGAAGCGNCQHWRRFKQENGKPPQRRGFCMMLLDHADQSETCNRREPK